MTGPNRGEDGEVKRGPMADATDLADKILQGIPLVDDRLGGGVATKWDAFALGVSVGLTRKTILAPEGTGRSYTVYVNPRGGEDVYDAALGFTEAGVSVFLAPADHPYRALAISVLAGAPGAKEAAKAEVIKLLETHEPEGREEE